jgi:hypothetical protein
MSRPLALRLTVGASLAAVLAASAVPAMAATTDETKVSYVVADGTRQFKVTEVDGATALADFTFGNDLQKPFRTVINDENRPLLSDGYQVNATMTNLYLKKADGTHDYTQFIPSKNLSLNYGATPLAGTSTLPVVPRLGLEGVIGTCADGDVAAALGITALTNPLGSLLDPAFALLSPLLQTVCKELGQLSGAARTVDVTLDGAVEMVTAPLSLSNLPFTLTGGESGQFVNPSYTGTIAGADPAKTATPPTAKRVMTGNPLALTGDLSLLLKDLTSTLTSQVPAVPIASDNTGIATLQDALAAISAENGPLVSTLSRLGVQDQLDMLLQLTTTLLPVDLSALTTVTGQYDAYPVLQAREFAAREGTYDGTLVVDFFETGAP